LGSLTDITRSHPARPDADRHGIVVRAAWLYYKDALTQAEIADRLFVSRATVGRLLEEARAEGIVRIEISADHLAAFQLSEDLRAQYGLADAVVVPRISGDASRERANGRVASAAAEYVKRFLRPGAVIGIAWGDTVARVLFSLSRDSLEDVTIVAIAGGIDTYTRDVYARNTNGVNEHLRIIPAPLLASSPKIAAALREDESVTSAVRLAETAVATLTGIGSAGPNASAVGSGLITDDQLREFRAMGAVGDMVGEWFDSQGRLIRRATSDRKIGMDIEHLRQLPSVIGVASGIEKVEAIRGAIRGGYLRVLITDESTGEALLAP
jgi:lsr operon transcriptional repressor